MSKLMQRRYVGKSFLALTLAVGLILGEGFAGIVLAQAAPPSNSSEERPEIVAPQAAHESPVSVTPVSWTPRVLGGKISSITQVGNFMIAGGSFSEVAPSSGSPVLNRSSVFAFSAVNGAINTGFAPTITGGVVNAVEPGPIPGTVFVGGSFQGINGVTGKVVLLDVETGQVVPSFTPPPMNGAVNDLQLIGDRLYIGGYFKRVASNDHGGLVTLDARTGDRDAFLQVNLTENHNYTGLPGQARAGIGAKSLAVTPQGDMLAVVGNFRKANGLERRQMALIDLTGSSAKLREDWKTSRLAPACFSHAFDTYVREIDVSPDGSHFVLATTGGPNPGTLCDTISRWEVDASGQDVQPTWIDDTGGDTLLSAASSGTAVYTGGHQRWMNNMGGRDYAAAGAVPRAGIGAVDADNGVPISWNPGRNPRGVGAEALYVTEGGLWVGSDTEWIGNRSYRRPRLAYFPVAGGKQLGPGETGTIPSNVYKVGDLPSLEVGEALYRVNAGGPSIAALDDGPHWMADDGASNPYRNSGSSTATYSSAALTVSSMVPSTTPPSVFNSERYNANSSATMKWDFPVPANEEVIVRLYFANRYEGTSAPGERVFSVRLEGQTILDSYDISGDVGHNVGTVKEVPIASDGTINLEWIHGTENPLINAIEILASADPDDDGPGEAATGLTRTWFTGGEVEEPSKPAPSGDIDWTGVRGAVVIDNELHYATATGDFIRRTFDGETYGPAQVIDPYNDPYWSNISTGSGGHNYRGVKPSFYGQIPSLTGMAFDNGRLYYTRVGSNRLFSRAFSPDSGVLTQTVQEAPVFTSEALGEVFFDSAAENLYFVTANTGDLSRIGWDGSEPVGSAEVVSGPAIDGFDWRGRALFLANGPQPIINEAPQANFEVECDRLECVFDGTMSADPDGEIVAYEWDFGDGSDGATDGTVPHTFDVEGTYRVTLTVTDDEGATGSVSAEQEVRANQPPVAVINDPECDLLECSFDGSQSSDPDRGDSIVSYEWDFGDGTAGSSSANPTHTFDEPGVYTVTLTVADEDGATGSAVYELALQNGPDPDSTVPELVGTATTSLRVSTPTVNMPDEIQAGDLLLLFVATNQADPYEAPAGWDMEKREVSGALAVSLFTRTAREADVGSEISLTLPGTFRSDLTVVAYRGVHEDGIETLASTIGSNTSTHVSPQGTIEGADRAALTFWADRSSTTTKWTAPSNTEVLSTQVGTGGGRLGTLLTAAQPEAGTYGPLTAMTDAASGRSVSLMVVLAPTDPSDPAEPDDPVRATPKVVSSVATSVRVETPSVQVPHEVAPGDFLLLFVATNKPEEIDAPTGWEPATRGVSGNLGVSLYTKWAEVSDIGSQVQIELSHVFRSDLTLVAFRDVGQEGIEVIEHAVDSNSASHPSPTVTSPGDGRLGVTYWADRSSSTTEWIVPTGVDVLSNQVGTGGGRVTTLLVNEIVERGAYGGLVAETDAASARALSLTLLLPPRMTP